jgi:hypothetical protein
MNELLTGKRASEVFYFILKENPQLTGQDLGRLVVAQFPNIDGAAIQLIRRWVGVGPRGGVSDSALDAGMAEFLQAAGYCA